MRPNDKTAPSSAAAAGIGRPSTRLFAGEGASVTAVNISAESLAPLAADGSTTRWLDATDPGGALAMSRDVSAVDVLFNCVGFVDRGTIFDCGQKGLTIDEFQCRRDVSYRAGLPPSDDRSGWWQHH